MATGAMGLLACFAIIPLTGCGLSEKQRTAAAQFAGVTAAIGEYAATELTRYRNEMMEMNAMSVALGNPETLGDLDEGLDPDDVAARVRAAEALAYYAQLLLSLVEETQEEALEKAAGEFVDSAKGITQKKLTDDQYEALGVLVRQIGGLCVEAQKKTALKRIVSEYKGDVDLLCDLLIADFDPDGLGFAQGVQVSTNRLTGDVVLANQAAGKTWEERFIVSAAALRTARMQARLKSVATRARATLEAIKKANLALEEALSSDALSLDGLKTLRDTASDLLSASRTLLGK